MATLITMPKLSYQMDQGTIVRWMKVEGDRIEKGEALLELETDKAIFEFESPQEGYLRKILGETGIPIPVLSPIAVLTDAPDDPFDIDALQKTPEPPKNSPKPTPAKSSQQSDTTQHGRVASSPAARRIGRELNVDLSLVVGTGPRGRITENDVRNAAKTPEQTISPTQEPLTRMRQAIAQSMVQSKTTIPHFYVSIDLDLTEEEAWRRNLPKQERPTINDVLIKALGLTLNQFPNLNSSFEKNHIIRHPEVHIGLAVGLEEGLLVPVISKPNLKPLKEVSQDRAVAVKAARQGRLVTAQSPTCTLTNLGMFGVTSFSAIITPPEALALSIGALTDEPKIKNGGIHIRQILTTTLSADHRLVDGLAAANFLAYLKAQIEDINIVKSW